MSAAFDLLAELPTGTTVLEASAGTGKTYTIAGLVTRYVAEGRARIDELLVVTFGRMATQELRDRVRARLVGARDALADPETAARSADPLLRYLAAEDVPARRSRLIEALSSFDAATVATTHEFCRRVLAGLGTAADVDENATFVENLDDLTVEVVQDLYLRMWARPNAGDPPMDVDAAIALAHEVVRDAQAVLIPQDAVADSVAGVRYRFATAVRAEVERRKRDRHLLTFDDLLTRLDATLSSADGGSIAAIRLRARYRVVLVDEFQDTDPVQWDILREAFHGHTTLVLIGDPKQAIYAFRGADVHAYLSAAEIADRHATLAHNWRSDPELLDGLDALFRGAALGDERIVVRPVTAGHPGRSIIGTGSAAVEIRALRSDPARVDAVRDVVVADVVAKIVTFLDGPARIMPRDGGAARPVRPGDIAVVVDTNFELDLIHDALVSAGVPSVRRTTSSVFKTAAGRDWIVLLEALEQPQRTTLLRRLAITPFVGWTAADLSQRDIDALALRIRHWVRTFEERGCAALLEAISRDERMPGRLLAQTDGERRLTDIRHVGEALHSAATTGQLGLSSLLDWLRTRVRESHRDTTAERSRRLDSDAAAVQIVTVWGSKGLEFPVVLVPFEWNRAKRDVVVPLFHDADGRRLRDVGGFSSSGFLRSVDLEQTEILGEHLRLLYVAMTRAQSHVTAWWGPSGQNTEQAPLHRLLFAADPATEVPSKALVKPADRTEPILRDLARPGCLDVAVIDGAAPARWGGAAVVQGELTARRFTRTLDTDWRRTSYSALTRVAYELAHQVGSEPEVAEKDDEPETPASDRAGDASLQSVPSPMSELPGGTGFGTLVHAVLEELDPGAGDLRDTLRGLVDMQLLRFGPGDLDADELTDALLPSIGTPLGPLAAGHSLATIPVTDRLAELDFEFPLCGGDRPSGRRLVRDLAARLRVHLTPDDPVYAYADLLEDPVVGDTVLRGYLGGSIDAVLRVDGRYLVVDYKTNRLGVPDQPLTAWDYRTDAVVEAMLHAHYPLQALLYTVALHRFLRWRITDYDPDQHLGGVLYLFLRGMCGPGVVGESGDVPGVFSWRPPTALVTALSDALAVGA